ncbi:MAG: EF-P lysine aminoacylase EpmA, partial [Smithellaceae bacterium]|nr:EF-P lysine aminoacylase EpmA [Smithellaceae bacterium]
PRLEALRIRERMMRAVRLFFTQHDYLEVETPLRIPAPAPEEHIDAPLAGDWFLQTSPELAMKRMLSQSFFRIFQICKCFRAGERGSRHLPEFTMLEWYRVGADYRGMMQECEDLLCFVAAELIGRDSIVYQGHTIDLHGPWKRLTVTDAFARYGSMSLSDALESDRFDEELVDHIETQLGFESPLILCDYPLSLGALARAKPDDPGFAERFELYMAGMELANAFSELIDPEEQRRRFATANDRRRAMGKVIYPEPNKFLSSLEEMPPAAGVALGLDRLAMIFSDQADISSVVTFTPEEL